MILSQTAVYALKAAIHLAEAEGPEPVRVDDIAAALGVPRNYLSKILHVLARAGVLTSMRGPNGGFRLTRDPGVVFLADVIAPFKDLTASSACFMGRERCSDATPCAAHSRWKGIHASLRDFLNDTTVDDLSRSGAGLAGIPEASVGRA